MNALQKMIKEQKRLLMGPDCRVDAQTVDLATAAWVLPKWAPLRDLHTSQEILRLQRPTSRYGVGVLYPKENAVAIPVEQGGLADGEDPYNLADQDQPADEEVPNGLGHNEPTAAEVSEEQEKLDRILGQNETGEQSSSPREPNSSWIVNHSSKPWRLPSMGVSFLVEVKDGDYLKIKLTGGRYQTHSKPPQNVQLVDENGVAGQPNPGADYRLYQRLPVLLTYDLPIQAECEINENFPADGPLSIRLYAKVRPANGNPNFRLVTVVVVNESVQGQGQGQLDERCLFQSRLRISLCDAQHARHPRFVPYPEAERVFQTEADESMRLLYHETPKYATGHGCAADWKRNADNQVVEVRGEPMPVYWAPSITADIEDAALSMRDLSNPQGLPQLGTFVAQYSNWIQQRVPETLEPRLQPAATRHVKEMGHALERMQRGLIILETDPQVQQAFLLANKAMRLQQLASGIKKREMGAPHVFHHAFSPPTEIVPEEEPTWRAFQIAFLLANIEGICDPNSPDRELVELIWFPTGGGKTEAYLGLIAFACILSRLRNVGAVPHVQVLMRYTMRLLTTQQFQRAASLFCALEYLRRQPNAGLGQEPFSLGLWVGNTTTPGTLADFTREFNDYVRTQGAEGKNILKHDQCPWCGAEVGRVIQQNVAGISNGGLQMYANPLQGMRAFQCSDNACSFYQWGLPFHIVDEIILRYRPTMVVATVDKFAQLPKKPALRALFGIGQDGNQFGPPPNLIVQDELHLIAEALGSLVGHFEPLIQYLCSRGGEKPKIVCSTATIRTYREQVRQLFGREQVCLFPPPEFSVGDSFFARYRRDNRNDIERRRAYVGVFGTGYDSFQTAESWVFASLLQAPMRLAPDERNPYWTLLSYFSSLRELGTTLTLANGQIRGVLKTMALNRSLSFGEVDQARGARRGPSTRELTSRVESGELQQVFGSLRTDYVYPDHPGCVDLCLATSVVEVGLDVPRLSSLVVVGQPPKAATYIQATGRVGRQHPAIIVDLFDHTRARDRSIYESFISFHERMYAEVEPTTLTPFAQPVLDRGLPAIIAGLVRLTFPQNDPVFSSPMDVNPNDIAMLADAAGEYPNAVGDLGKFLNYLTHWAEIADPVGFANVAPSVRKRLGEWRNWQRGRWHRFAMQNPMGATPLMLDMDPTTQEREGKSFWFLPNSMRSVDANGNWCIDGGTWATNVNQMLLPNTDTYPN